MIKNFSRREFIKIGGAGLCTLGAAKKLIGKSSTIQPLKSGRLTKIPTYCEMCTFKCAGFVHLHQSKPWKITGNPKDQHCYGRLCTKGSAGIGAYDDPDRLKTPLIRSSVRGKQVFREASWDEALDYIAGKMKVIAEKYGPEAVALFTHGTGGSFFKQLMKAYGSRNIAAPSYSNCRGPREEAYLLTYGSAINSPENTDMKNSRCIVLLGSHIGENTHSAQVNEFAQAIRKGASIITVDPRFSVAAGKSKYWLPVKPGTDMALLLAWIHVIIEEELYDKEYVKSNTTGFEELKKAVSKNSPEWAYPITSIKASLIRETAREMAKHAPATLVHPGRHVVWYGDDTQRVRAGAILNALLGSWGRKGGFYLPVEPEVPAYPHPKYPKPTKSWRDRFKGKFDLANLAIASGICDATIPASGQFTFKGWIVYGSNLIHTLPDMDNTIKAIQNLDLLVAVDILPAEITGWADVVLPECTYLERYDELRTSPGREMQVALRMPAMKPLYDSKPAWWMVKKLADKLDLSKFFPWKDIEGYLDYRLKKVGTSLKELKKTGVKVLSKGEPVYFQKGEVPEFGTDSGKIELWSKTLEDYGFDPIPEYKSHQQPSEGYYRLIYGRTPSHSFGRTTNNPILTQLVPENEVWVNTRVAEEWGIKTGQYIKLENQDGKVGNPVKVKVTERIRTDCVFMVHGFGHKQKKLKRSFGKGASVTRLITKTATDPIMGGVGMRGNFVTFRLQDRV